MKPFSFTITSDHFLLCVSLSLLWVVTDSNSTVSPLAPTPTHTTAMNTTATTTTAMKTTAMNTTATTTTAMKTTAMKTTAMKTTAMNTTATTTTAMKTTAMKKTAMNTTATTTTAMKKTAMNTTATTTTKMTTTPSTTLSTTKAPPRNAEEFKSVNQTETSITLQWKKVGDILNYKLDVNGTTINVTASMEEEYVTRTINNLTCGIKYKFTLFTLFDEVTSSGVPHEAVTAPCNAKELKSVNQTETSITLQWKKVGDILKYKLDVNGTTINVTASMEEEYVTRTINNLTCGIKYKFTLFTLFDEVTSSGVPYDAVTAPCNAEDLKSVNQTETSITLQWKKVDNILNYKLVVNGERKESATGSMEEEYVTHKISNLTCGTRHNFTLFTEFENITSTGVNYSAPTAPCNAKELKSVGQTETSITLQWKKVGNILNYKLDVNGTTINVTASMEEEYVTRTINNLTCGFKYKFTLFTLFDEVTSSGVPYDAVTAPCNAKEFKSVGQTETSITLQWKKVGDILKYKLVVNGEPKENVTGSKEKENVTHKISNLTCGTRYNFILFTEFENVRSTGVNYSAPTVPPMVTSVQVTKRNTTSVTLQWQTVNQDWDYSLTVNEMPQQPPIIIKQSVSYSMSSLTPGTRYNFSVVTTFFGLNSRLYEDFTVTALDCTWDVTSSSIQGAIKGLFSKATADNGTLSNAKLQGSKVLFTDLWPGATYIVSVVYETESKSFQQCHHDVTILPSQLTASCEYFDAGYSVFVIWSKPVGVWTSVEVNVSGCTRLVWRDEEQQLKISGFLPARRYEVSLYSKSGNRNSGEPFVFSCLTDPRGVIAGAVFGVLIFCLLVFLAVFIIFKRPDIIGRTSFIGGTRESIKMIKDIPLAKFPEHFYHLSMDQGRGFSEEYESLIPVGVEQTKEAALLPQNKPRNRFNNILPYDWCRVRLTTLNHSGASDYINACYMPGYKSDRDYIATQGPLPATVNDFWRMIWEQRVKGIVMVTNCTEGGRTKCEQYWPADRTPCSHGELLVSIRSEQKEPNWTLREFRVKHRHHSEERTVRHFHFTAWPDHGVPQCTGVLIQFRGLVRQHIEREGAAAPTVVHCSAGVGRTGTIIALDVLLQQLERERAVGINGFVRKMRLRRPHMVQTESQYVFLHQCIMDRLQQDEETEEHIYENAEMIYTNATALRELTRT
ncbi:receptor-type tyrosine-protein phosphatase H-like isoform X3 [Pungitius pungitius]|uniref:receptor-type tyrosine-protein phosphatase H-like isoform X3 n=1 Tax=Pungitius pungitius TaxID=134920 RepID=UPI002E127855